MIRSDNLVETADLVSTIYKEHGDEILTAVGVDEHDLVAMAEYRARQALQRASTHGDAVAETAALLIYGVIFGMTLERQKEDS